MGAQPTFLYSNTAFGKAAGTTAFGTWTIATANPSASINNTSVIVGPNSVTAKFTVTLSAASNVPVTLGYATADGTATAGTDYTAESGTVSFAAGVTTATISVPVTGGATDASGLQFTVALTNPANATIGTGTGTCTIDHDTAPVNVSLATLPLTSQSGTPETLTSTVSDTAGAADIASVELRVGHTSSYATSLSAVYNQTTNLLYLYDTSGNLMMPGFAPGSTAAGGGDNVITNSLGSLDCTQTTVTASGNNLVIGWYLTPATGLIGAQPTYLYSNTAFGKTTGTTAFGTWTITSLATSAFDGGENPVPSPFKPSGHSS